jgi:hypothetical protein
MKVTASPLLVLLGLFFLVGCGPSIVNLTPNPVPTNASGIYTLSMGVRNTDGAVMKETYQPKVVVDGQEHPMRLSDTGGLVYDFDYLMPQGRRQARYYFVLDYLADYSGTPGERKVTSEVYDLRLINRYVITLASQRGPVGAEIPVVGSGFSKYDSILIGGLEAETRFESANALSFVVPALRPDTSYVVELLGSQGKQSVGQFYIDSSRLRVTPKQMSLRPSERSVMAFAIDFDAPEGGLLIDVKTDRPRSIVMPVVQIPQGSRSVSVNVEGGRPGSGTLFVNALGFSEVQVPFVVRDGQSQEFVTQGVPADLSPEAREVIIMDGESF